MQRKKCGNLQSKPEGKFFFLKVFKLRLLATFAGRNIAISLSRRPRTHPGDVGRPVDPLRDGVPGEEDGEVVAEHVAVPPDQVVGPAGVVATEQLHDVPDVLLGEVGHAQHQRAAEPGRGGGGGRHPEIVAPFTRRDFFEKLTSATKFTKKKIATFMWCSNDILPLHDSMFKAELVTLVVLKVSSGKHSK